MWEATEKTDDEKHYDMKWGEEERHYNDGGISIATKDFHRLVDLFGDDPKFINYVLSTNGGMKKHYKEYIALKRHENMCKGLLSQKDIDENQLDKVVTDFLILEAQGRGYSSKNAMTIINNNVSSLYEHRVFQLLETIFKTDRSTWRWNYVPDNSTRNIGKKLITEYFGDDYLYQKINKKYLDYFRYTFSGTISKQDYMKHIAPFAGQKCSLRKNDESSLITPKMVIDISTFDSQATKDLLNNMKESQVVVPDFKKIDEVSIDMAESILSTLVDWGYKPRERNIVKKGLLNVVMRAVKNVSNELAVNDPDRLEAIMMDLVILGKRKQDLMPLINKNPALINIKMFTKL